MVPHYATYLLSMISMVDIHMGMVQIPMLQHLIYPRLAVVYFLMRQCPINLDLTNLPLMHSRTTRLTSKVVVAYLQLRTIQEALLIPGGLLVLQKNSLDLYIQSLNHPLFQTKLQITG